MKIVICDDNQECIEDIEQHLNQYAFEHGLSFELFEFSSGEEVLNSNEVFDIAFLDIEIDETNGLFLGKKLQERNSNIVLIFVTNYERYLDDALDLGTTRFLDKPINSARFYRGLDKAIQKVDSTEIAFHIYDENNGLVTLQTNDIIYVEIKGRKTKVTTKTNNILYSKDSIKEWKIKLNKSYFLSPHNSFIINANYITYFQKDHIILDGKYYIPVAYGKRAEFKKQYLMMVGS